MFRRSSSDVLDITVDGERFVFQSPRDFEFALAGRTSVPVSKIITLSRMSDDGLLREAEAIRAVEQRFADALSGTLEDITSVGPLLQSMEPSIISQDNGWRSIIDALNTSERPCETYKKIALVKYMQYLTARQEVVKSLFANRQRNVDDEQRNVNGGGVHRPTARFRETLIFDLNASNGDDEHDTAYSRLPKGETVELALEPDEALDILLAKHQCRIVSQEGLHFVDERGIDSELHMGRNVVGRDTASDVVIDSNLRDVSRKHLIVETDGSNRLRLTDISSHGTSLPPKFLDHTSI
jgi:hypothetical protein